MWHDVSMAEYLRKLQNAAGKSKRAMIAPSKDPILVGWILKPSKYTVNFSIFTISDYEQLITECSDPSSGLVVLTCRIYAFTEDEYDVPSTRIKSVREDILVQLVFGIRCDNLVFDLHFWRVGRPNGMLLWHATLWIMKVRRELSLLCFGSRVESAVRGCVCLPQDGVSKELKEERLVELQQYLISHQKVNPTSRPTSHDTSALTSSSVWRILVRLRYAKAVKPGDPLISIPSENNAPSIQSAIKLSKKLLAKYHGLPIERRHQVSICRPYSASISVNLHWSGSLFVSDAESVANLKITHFIRLGNEYQNPNANNNNMQLDVPVEDSREASGLYMAFLSYLVAYIIDVIQDNGTILIYCNEGVSRSCTLIMAYLILKERLTWTQAMNQASRLRSCSNPNIGFLQRLSNLEKIYIKQESVKYHLLTRVYDTGVYAFMPLLDPPTDRNIYVLVNEKAYVYIHGMSDVYKDDTINSFINVINGEVVISPVLQDIWRDYTNVVSKLGLELPRDLEDISLTEEVVHQIGGVYDYKREIAELVQTVQELQDNTGENTCIKGLWSYYCQNFK